LSHFLFRQKKKKRRKQTFFCDFVFWGESFLFFFTRWLQKKRREISIWGRPNWSR
jgi:hypothetical protein